MYGMISPKDWNLRPATQDKATAIKARLGVSFEEVERRWKRCVDEWFKQHFSEEEGTFYGFYDWCNRRFEPPQLVNLIAPWAFIAAYDRYGDGLLLGRASLVAEWLYSSPFVISHPMSLAIGGVLDNQIELKQAWTKYTAEYVILNLGLHKRIDNDRKFLSRALQSGEFLIQAVRHGFATKYHLQEEVWDEKGWQAFGRVIEAFLDLYETTGETKWQDHAIDYGGYALSLQAENGCFHLINGEYYNSDLAADPLRALTFLFEATGEDSFLTAAKRYADWHLEIQNEDGSWPINIDRGGNIVCAVVGPGDIPNIGISLLRLHQDTNDDRYLESAIRAFRYSLRIQITPTDHPYGDDPRMRWGFWSWMPLYDYTVSGDQATHHVRGLMFVADYLASLEGG